MITTVTCVLLGVVSIVYIIFYKLFLKQRIPNGLKELPKSEGWPLVGLLFSFKKPMYSYLFGLKEKHGPIFKFRLGSRDLVVLNSATVMNKTLKELGQNFSGRWKNIFIKKTFHNSGILFTDKEWWSIQRGFILKVLRDFGLGKQVSQEIVNNECGHLMNEIEEICGQSISIEYLFPKYMLNVIAKLVTNSRFERNDPNFPIMTRLLGELAQDDHTVITIFTMFPIFEKIPILSNIVVKLSSFDRQYSEVHTCVKDIINEHVKRFDPNNEGEDLIDMFLKERHSLDSSNIKGHTFTDWQLIRVVTELFVAGFDTTSSTLSWSMLLLAKHPYVQERVHKEIIEIIGTSRAATLADKKSLNYTQAVMDEIFRCSSVVPLSLPHQVFEDTSVDGFYIPKNSIIVPNIYGIHHDKTTWEKPFEFYPEHFLIEMDGISKYRPRDDLMPFSIGKRQCLGESLARLEFFIFLTSILQKFKVRFPKDLTVEEFERIKIGTDGVIRAPLSTEIIFELRQ